MDGLALFSLEMEDERCYERVVLMVLMVLGFAVDGEVGIYGIGR